MLMRTKKTNKNILSKAQNRLLRISLKRLLGDGLIRGEKEKESQIRSMVLKDALNAMVLNN